MIFHGASISAIVLCALATLSSVSAVPTPDDDYPEVVPGPGMPSLASLGLTSKDLYEGAGVTGKRDLLTRFDRICYDNGCGRVPRGDAQACINYLRNLGTQRCGLSGENVVMCSAGVAIVGGSNITGRPVSSYCSDVAIGGQNIINACTDGNGLVAGADAANGNGDLIVWIEHTGC
ncbi:hypothetical protein M408DRAFT_333198 [Serendipita vermifera MAFF 305830]|uniref:Cyanovirin-N domain-containing protein n=1 Tax=Serendipita vermifera MAFF 305830 TaxID=933852 RepID=A0A0C2WWX7_SERVB|nr:hypothetical protein M408DRAFT_333198 [Serendipita vermifera MAFF 305830]